MIRILHLSDFHLYGDIFSVSRLFKVLSSFRFSPLRQTYSYANDIAKVALPTDLIKLTQELGAVQVDDVIVAMTGDITAWPANPKIIDGQYFGYFKEIKSSVGGSVETLVTLGNHDWGGYVFGPRISKRRPFVVPGPKLTTFIGTNFDRKYKTTKPHALVVNDGKISVVFFMIQSTDCILPAVGEITEDSLTFLRDKFREGHKNGLGNLSQANYQTAVKIVLLHHSPLERDKYNGALSRREFDELQLLNYPALRDVCANEIDIFLFGHTHVSLPETQDGFVMLDAGTTLADNDKLSLNIIRILDRRRIEVTPCFWNSTNSEFERGRSVFSFDRRRRVGWVRTP